jgi:hypothetical protein
MEKGMVPFITHEPASAAELKLMKLHGVRCRSEVRGRVPDQPHPHLFLFATRGSFCTEKSTVKCLLRFHRIEYRDKRKGESAADYLFYLNGMFDSFIKLKVEQWSDPLIWPARFKTDAAYFNNIRTFCVGQLQDSIRRTLAVQGVDAALAVFESHSHIGRHDLLRLIGNADLRAHATQDSNNVLSIRFAGPLSGLDHIFPPTVQDILSEQRTDEVFGEVLRCRWYQVTMSSSTTVSHNADVVGAPDLLRRTLLTPVFLRHASGSGKVWVESMGVFKEFMSVQNIVGDIRTNKVWRQQ